MATQSEQVTLRTFKPGDLPWLHEIDDAFQREVRPNDEPFHHDDMDDIDGTYLNAGGAFWVLEDRDGEVVGYGAVLRVDDATARLRRFRVRADRRRRGLATRLLLEAERFCAERGYRRITLGTTDLQQPAQVLYRKHGYVEAGERWFGPDLRDIEFVKELG